MPMVLIFSLLLVTVMTAWLGRRDASIYLFFASYFFAVGLFFHHLTDVIGLSL